MACNTLIQGVLLALVFSNPVWADRGFVQRCIDGARKLAGLWHPPPMATSLPMADSHVWIAPQGRTLLNGTLINARDAEGKPAQILVLSHYLTEHVDKDLPLPDGWKFVSHAHRGEYEFQDGVVARVNQTSGNAYRTDSPNPLSAPEKFLQGTALVDPNITRYVKYKEGEEHFYPGFNRPPQPSTGDPARDKNTKLHSVRLSLQISIQSLETMLKARQELPSPLTGRKILDHWEVLVADLPKNQNVDLIKAVLDIQSKHPNWQPDRHQANLMRAGIEWMRQQQRRYQYLVVRR